MIHAGYIDRELRIIRIGKRLRKSADLDLVEAIAIDEAAEAVRRECIRRKIFNEGNRK